VPEYDMTQLASDPSKLQSELVKMVSSFKGELLRSAALNFQQTQMKTEMNEQKESLRETREKVYLATLELER